TTAVNPAADPALRSSLPVTPVSHFPIQNLPYCVFSRRSDLHIPRGGLTIGVGIGEHILDLRAVGGFGLLDPAGLGGNALQSGHDLNLFLRLGKPAWTAARQTISRLLRQDLATIRDNAKMREKVLVRQADVVLK